MCVCVRACVCVCARVCACVRVRVCVIKNVKYTDQNGSTETSIMFLILIQKRHADVSSSENIRM